MKKSWSELFWDLWCTISIVGIWPRFIEPKLLSLTKIKLPITDLPTEFNGLKILHFSDLHWNKHYSLPLLKKLTRKINATQPDFIFFTGDLICRSNLEEGHKLRNFLCSLKANYGSFAILGNHDYEKFVSLNQFGDYDVKKERTTSTIRQGFRRLLSPLKVSGVITQEAKNVQLHQGIIELFKNTPFKLLHNVNQLVPYKGSFINVCGIGEYILGQADLKSAFQVYDKKFPGIILVHNPDAIPKLCDYPGQLILSGHTHGGQVNLPWLRRKLTYMENYEFMRGLKKHRSKWIYTSRGVGSVMHFRWFSIPEITLVTLRREEE